MAGEVGEERGGDRWEEVHSHHTTSPEHQATSCPYGGARMDRALSQALLPVQVPQ